MKLAHVPFGSPLLVISCSTLAQFYIFKIFQKTEALKGTEKVVQILSYISGGIGFLSLLFLMLNWPGKYGMAVVFLFLLLLTGLIVAAKQIEITQVISRLEALTLFGLFILILSGNFGLI
ncbi:MAG: hypothetical protein AB8B56_20580 [Crocinitomicaceae bacterium]